ncbi:MAG: EF-P lysine aminoacylase EpmA [Oligoflexales bacterium]
MDIKVAKKRAELFQWVRTYFHQKDFLEVDTPILVPCPGAEVHMEYFKTEWKDFQNTPHSVWLRSSPELHLKQALASGASNVFEIAKCFRNHGELTRLHQPEFTMLEWYQTGQTYEDMIDFTEKFIQECAAYFNVKIPKMTKFTVAEAFLEFAQIELIDLDSGLAEKAEKAGVVSVSATDDFETAYFKTLIEVIEPQLHNLGNTVLYHFPASQSALAEIENGVAKRFEFYIHGVELCNGYQELTDLQANIRRFNDINTQRSNIGKDPLAFDQNFIKALKKGISACCGNALGLDRLLSILQGKKDLDYAIAYRQQEPFHHIWDQ